MDNRIADTVYAALSRQLKVPAERLRAQSAESLDRLGLDSHGLMRVLLDIERELKLSTALELPDEALENPATLASGVTQAVGGA
ncbi:MAG TPA: acyl carrier protein [Planctomycetota bacterium]|jgi:acyl carrier protein|nr:acyl carrier protein [Planctomycetota bacterium]